jgi:hypothetical protein
MQWVTWQDVGVDRMGCAWLIKRFIDPDAEFVFVAPGATSLPEGAEPFDIPGTRLSHHEGHSSFHTIVRAYKLADWILQRMAQMVDEADVVQEVMVEPAAPGLDLICRGIRMTSPDDWLALERGYLIYDAVYAYCQHRPGGSA